MYPWDPDEARSDEMYDVECPFGSVISYLLGITQIEPLQYGLFFERFLNPDRIGMPDIDIDFCAEGRSKIIDYVIKKYGRESVAQIITFGTLGAKSVIKDVARVMEVPAATANEITKLIPSTHRITLEEALELPRVVVLDGHQRTSLKRLRRGLARKGPHIAEVNQPRLAIQTVHDLSQHTIGGAPAHQDNGR